MYGRCYCDPGFRGSTCNQAVKEVCPGGCGVGVCLHHHCICPDGFQGDNCEQENATVTNAATSKLMELKSRSLPSINIKQTTSSNDVENEEAQKLSTVPITAVSSASPSNVSEFIEEPSGTAAQSVDCSNANSFSPFSLQILVVLIAFLSGIVVAYFTAQCCQRRREKLKRTQMLKPLIQP